MKTTSKDIIIIVVQENFPVERLIKNSYLTNFLKLAMLSSLSKRNSFFSTFSTKFSLAFYLSYFGSNS